MTTIRLPELAPYRRGDLAKIPCNEPDPVPGWAELTEKNAHDLRSVVCNGQVVATMGYFPTSILEADAFAVVDRSACKGIGRQVAAIIREQQLEWMRHTGIEQANASCAANDRAARVFLQVIGYTLTDQTNATTAHFVMSRS